MRNKKTKLKKKYVQILVENLKFETKHWERKIDEVMMNELLDGKFQTFIAYAFGITVRVTIDLEYEKIDDEAATLEAMLNPKKGDRFHEMYSYWVYVVKTTKYKVWIIYGSNFREFPNNSTLEIITKKEFFKKYEYNCPGLENKFSVSLADRGNDVKGWLV